MNCRNIDPRDPGTRKFRIDEYKDEDIGLDGMSGDDYFGGKTEGINKKLSLDKIKTPSNDQ